jgi:hypothetical protein
LADDQRWLFIGTGRQINNSDLSSDIINTMYAFREGTKQKADAFTDRSRSDLSDIDTYEKNGGGGLGWYHDMEEGFHLNVTPKSAYNMIVYAANRYIKDDTGPLYDACDSTNFEGRLYARNFITGKNMFDDDYIHIKNGVTNIEIVVIEDPKNPGQKIPAILVDTTQGEHSVITFDKFEGGGDSGNSDAGDSTGTDTPERYNIRYILN